MKQPTRSTTTTTTTTNNRKKKRIKDDEDWEEDQGRFTDDMVLDEEEDDIQIIDDDDEDGEDEEEDVIYSRRPSKRRRITHTTSSSFDSKSKSTTSTTTTTTTLSTNPRPHPESYHHPLPTLLNGGQAQIELLNWFEGIRDKRGMPWRKRYIHSMNIEEKGQRAYEIWISEVMLQQTQVTTVIPYWQRWMKKWPTISHLAQADIEDVNSEWRGLGYYRRAKGLLQGSKRVEDDVERYHGRLPDNPSTLEKEIEGIGRYTAGAICSMAYGVTTPIVDGNIHRLLCRLLGLHAPTTSPLLIKKLWAVAEMLVVNVVEQHEGSKDGVAGDWNQALMEVGNQICKPTGPDCSACPVRSGCRAYAELSGPPPPPLNELDCTICCPPFPTSLKHKTNGGIPAVTIFPMKKATKTSREEMTAVCLLKWEGGNEERWLMVKRPEKGLLAGLFEPPSTLVPPQSEMEDQISIARTTIDKILLPLSEDITLSDPSSCGSFLHVFSHINMTYSVHAITITGSVSPPAVDPEFTTQAIWMTAEQIKHANIGTGTKKLWTMVYGPAVFGSKSKVKGSKPGSSKGKKGTAEEEAVRDGKVVKKIAMPSMPLRAKVTE